MSLQSVWETVDGRKADEITVSLIRDVRPDGMFQYFAEAGTDIRETYPGIYYLYPRAQLFARYLGARGYILRKIWQMKTLAGIEGTKILFPTQVVVIKGLAEANHAYLRVLTRRPQKTDVNRFLELYRGLSEKAEREYTSSILEVFTEANRKWVEQWKGEDEMGPVLMEIMAPELQEAENKGREEGIHGAVDILQGLGYSSAKIKEVVMKRYCLSEKETAKFL